MNGRKRRNCFANKKRGDRWIEGLGGWLPTIALYTFSVRPAILH
jgi:hypothetical protein